LTRVSSEVGIIAPNAWAKTSDGLMVFLSNDGVYVWGIGGESPQRWSEERAPEQLRNIDPEANIISMVYDPRGRGFHLFVTPATGVGVHWWLDLNRKALWPTVFTAGHQPVAVSRLDGAVPVYGGPEDPVEQDPVVPVYGAESRLADIVVGCKDGNLRRFSPAATTDDGVAFQSHVLIGPFAVSSDTITDAILAEVHGSLADGSGLVNWRLVTGSTPEEAADAAVAGIESTLGDGDPEGVVASGTWTENRNRVVRPRARGPWAVLWLSSLAQWAYETVAVRTMNLGRLR
jgi:hypothetical protein